MVTKLTYAFRNFLRLTGCCGCLLWVTSCAYFETKKVDSETIYQQDLEAISWDEVDQFPLFDLCSESAEKQAQQTCFANELSRQINAYFKNQNLQAVNSLVDTIGLQMKVLNNGSLLLDTVAVSEATLQTFPEMRSWITEAVSQCKTPQPAIKRGIPVAVKFTLPVVLTTTD